MTNTTLNLEINSLPKELRDEVADFVEFLKNKSKPKPKLKAREFGFAKGKIFLSPDFDEPLEDFLLGSIINSEKTGEDVSKEEVFKKLK